MRSNRAIDRDARKRCALPGERHRGRYAAFLARWPLPANSDAQIVSCPFSQPKDARVVSGSSFL